MRNPMPGKASPSALSSQEVRMAAWLAAQSATGVSSRWPFTIT